MQLIFHGGAGEVGRSCIELRTGKDRYLLDCGLKFHAGGVDYPAKVFDTRTVDAVFLSHAHLDHSGGLPFFEHFKMACPIFATKETRDIYKVLIEDSYKIAHIKRLAEPYERADLHKALKDIRIVRFNERRRFRSIAFEYLNAGHIPGSASVKIEAEGKKIVYTGDYNTTESVLMHAADPASWGEVDILITEATYGSREHPDRESARRQLIETVREVTGRGGTALIPVFAVGRAQEILLMLGETDWKVPIYMDGMAKKITRITGKGPDPFVKRKSLLGNLYKNIRLVKNPRARESIARKPGIIITTSGMMQGGPVMSYMDAIHDDPDSAVLLTGYQVKHTHGQVLADEKTWRVGGEDVKVACEVSRFDFSAHLSREGIQRAILSARPKTVIFNHGSPDAIEEMEAWAREHTNAHVYAPRVGDQLDVNEHVEHLRLYTQDDGYAFPAEHQHGQRGVPAPADYSVEHDE